MTPLALKIGATALTLLSLAGSTLFVVRHVKNPAAPLHPPVVRLEAAPAAPTRTRLHLEPSVRVTEGLAPLTWTYVS